MQLQYFDTLEDHADEDCLFVPTGVIAHRLSIVPRRDIIHNNNGTNIQITKESRFQVKTCWINGEVSWGSADALKEQNTWILSKYATQQGLPKHPYFAWTTKYL